MSGARVRFVIHEGRRSGPPIYARDVLGWLARHTDLDLGAVLLTGGPLEAELAEICPTAVLDEDRADAVSLLEAADLAYINTAVSIRALRETLRRPSVVVTHVHELEVGLSYWLSAADHQLLVDATDRFLVGPRCAVDNLVAHHGVPRDKIGQVAYFVPPRTGAPDGLAPRRAHAIAGTTVLVGVCGAREWRKAPDLFAALAWWCRRSAPELDLRFVWLGSAIPTGPHWDQVGDEELLGLGSQLLFLEDDPDPDPWLASFDVYASTSREDLFPLACLTACSFGVPAVTFDGGGIAELVTDSGGGVVVPYPEVESMAAAVVDLARDRPRRSAMGERARTYVDAHHTLDIGAAQVAHEIEELVG